LQLSHLILLLISNATAFMPRHKSRATEVETNVRSCVMSRQSAERNAVICLAKSLLFRFRLDFNS
jgi:hypothetical protein